jgi:hypothetical protein
MSNGDRSRGVAASSKASDLVTAGELQEPDDSQAFPAKLMTTPLTWADPVLAPEVLDEIDTLKAGCATSAPSSVIGAWRVR